MKERPILFNGDMVRAILSGQKMQTRRPVKPPFEIHPNGFITKADKNGRFNPYQCPFGQPADRLWVRETWAPDAGEILYRADLDSDESEPIQWHPSIHMPRAASRILLEIDESKIERVQDITEDGARAEGVVCPWYPAYCNQSYTDHFMELWDFIYLKQGFEWDANPFVWVVKFHRMEVSK
jgi:hypothetical protein